MRTKATTSQTMMVMTLSPDDNIGRVKCILCSLASVIQLVLAMSFDFHTSCINQAEVSNTLSMRQRIDLN